MHNVSDDSAYINTMLQLAEMIVARCYWLVPLLITAVLIYSISQGLLYGQGVKVDYSPVVRGFVLLIIIFFYGEWMDMISGAIGGFVNFLPQTGNIHESLNEMINHRTGEDLSGDTIQDYIKTIAGIFQLDFYQLVGNFLSSGVVSIIRRLLELIRQSLLGFLYVCGPIALAFSVIPAFGGLAIKWLQNYLSVQFWSITLVILDNIVALYAIYFTESHNSSVFLGSEFSEINFIVVSIATTILYLMVPYLTSFFIGISHSSSFQSKVMGFGLATSAIMLSSITKIGSAIGRFSTGRTKAQQKGEKPAHDNQLW